MRERRKNAQFLRHLIYDLKRDYGFPIIIVKTLSTDMDLESGVKRPTLSYHKIKRAIFLPSRAFRSFVYDLSFVASNKNFTSGAFFDPTERIMFLDERDIDTIKIDDIVIYDDKEHIVSEIRDFIEQTVFGIKMRHVEGQSLNDPSNQTIIEIITLTDSTAGVKT